MAREFKHQYLIRLIATTLAFFYIPLLLYFSITLPRTYNELLNAREEQYNELTRLFSLSFEKQVMESYAAAMQLAMETRISKSPLHILSSPLYSRNPYYYLECVRAIENYARDRNFNPLIFFPQTNSIFSQSYKYTAESYITDKLNIKDITEARQIREFFLNPESSINYYSTFPLPGDRGQLLLGFPVKTGMIKEEALVFFVMNRDSVDTSGLYAGKEGIQFMVFNAAANLLYKTGNSFPVDISAIIEQAEASGGMIKSGNVRYRLFRIKGQLGNIFVSVVPFDRITSEVYASISTVRKIGIAAGILILFLLCLMIYFNYKPVGNFADEMSERNQLVLDLLLGNLLHGLPIPQKEAERLGLAGSNPDVFFVIAVFEYKFNSENRKMISTVFNERFSAACYITDILYRDHAVIICRQSRFDTVQLKEFLKNLIPQPGTFEIGPAVTSLEEVKKSYWACLDQRNKKESPGNTKDEAVKTDLSMEKAKSFRESVVRYVEEQFANPQLSQISVADYFGISIYSLSRLFNNEIGIGFAEFITAKRMEAAKSLLLSTDREISDIAKSVGLVNSNYFSRLFKSYFGIIPSRYRLKNN